MDAGNTTVSWGIIAPGAIARKFAQALVAAGEQDGGIRRMAVASRSERTAQDFARQFGFGRWYGSYDELLDDPDVDIVYIASPHPFHAPLSITALNHGKHVLCEKPAALNVGQLDAVAGCARQNGRFYMEALWTRCNPTVLAVMDWIRQGAIGTVTHVEASFCFAGSPERSPRLFVPELAGGALLDVGIYPVAFAMMCAGGGAIVSPRSIASVANMQGAVDGRNSIVLRFDGGMTACLQSAVTGRSANPTDAFVYGTTGRIEVPRFWMAQEAFLYRDGAEQPADTVRHAFAPNGYEHEIREAVRCIRQGLTQSGLHSVADSRAICTVLDQCRAQWGLTYPAESGQPVAKTGAQGGQQTLFDAEPGRATQKAPAYAERGDTATGAQQARPYAEPSGTTTAHGSAESRGTPGADDVTEVTIYTDGGCHGNPGPGGWACVLLYGTTERTLSGGQRDTTNNRMELTAAIQALEAVAQDDVLRHKPVRLLSDSQYVKNGITGWIRSWKANGWLTSSKKPVLNKDLWMRLDQLNGRLHVQWSWVKGHAGIRYNELCDTLCQQEIARL